jgi:hypothetical protein
MNAPDWLRKSATPTLNSKAFRLLVAVSVLEKMPLQLVRDGTMPVQKTGKRRKRVPKKWVNRRIEQLLRKADEQATVKTPSAPHLDT